MYIPLIIVGVLRLEICLGMGVVAIFLPMLILYKIGGLHPYQRGFADLIAGTWVIAEES